MSLRVLIVDDVDANRKVLRDMMAQDYYQISEAEDGRQALAAIAADPPDMILLDVMMPHVDGLAVCRRLKGDPATAHIPIILITALAEREDRLRGLAAGADDYLAKPVDRHELRARLRSLARLKLLVDELRAREAQGRRIGAIEAELAPVSDASGRILLVSTDRHEIAVLQAALNPHFTLDQIDPAPAGTATPDLVIVSLTGHRLDGLAVLSSLRAAEISRRLPIIGICAREDREKAQRALELGAHDVLYAPLDGEEALLRVQTTLRRARMLANLRNALDQGFESAVTDQLTGLHNRRFMLMQFHSLAARAAKGGDPVSILMIDIDHFKRINDDFGHAAGDEVLKEFAVRISKNFRAIDLACRYGGEEFTILMPGAGSEQARLIAERLRREVAANPFPIRGGRLAIEVTISIGVATVTKGDTAEQALKRADAALYQAKSAGRNRVTFTL